MGRLGGLEKTPVNSGTLFALYTHALLYRYRCVVYMMDMHACVKFQYKSDVIINIILSYMCNPRRDLYWYPITLPHRS